MSRPLLLALSVAGCAAPEPAEAVRADTVRTGLFGAWTSAAVCWRCAFRGLVFTCTREGAFLRGNAGYYVDYGSPAEM